MRLILTLLLAAMASLTSAQTVLYVDDSAPAGGDGSSWGSAFRFLTDALDACAQTTTAEEVRIAAGTYRPDQSASAPWGTFDQCATFTIPGTREAGVVTIIGGYRGIGTPGDPDEYDPEVHETILSGDTFRNDPVWPFDGEEPEWNDNIYVIMSALNGVVDIRGIRFVGAGQCFFDSGRSRQTPPFDAPTSITIRDCVFSDSPLNSYGPSEIRCDDDTPIHSGIGVYLGRNIQHRNGNFPILLENVFIERVHSPNSGYPVIDFKAKSNVWRGGGMRDCIIFTGVFASTAGYVGETSIELEDLVFEHIDIVCENRLNPKTGLVLFERDVISSVRDCVFRDIYVESHDNVCFPILGLEALGGTGDVQYPRVVENCVFETIEQIPFQPSNTVACFGATLISGCQFKDFEVTTSCAASAVRIENTTFEEIVAGGISGAVPRGYMTLEDGTTLNMSSSQAVVQAYEYVNTNILNCSTGKYGMKVAPNGRASNCLIEGCTVHTPYGGGTLFRGLVFADVDTTLSGFTVRANTHYYGLLTPVGYGNSTAGIVLSDGAVLMNSEISGNRNDGLVDGYFASSALWMRPNSSVYNCVIVDNGFPAGASTYTTDTTVAAAPSELGDVYIVGSTICGNIGSSVGGIDMRSDEGRVHLINSVVAQNIADSDESCEVAFPDLTTDCEGVPTDFVVVNSYVTQDAPQFVNAQALDFRPAPGSVLIDSAADGWLRADVLDLDGDGDLAEPVPFDAIGQPRFVDDPSTPDSIEGFFLDVGAYEYQRDSASCPADTNGDGMLSPADFTAWIAAFNTSAPACDQNGDGLCTPADFTAWIANYNAGC